MKVFIWHQISRASDNYHTDGGVVVFAENEGVARELASEKPGCFIGADENPDDVRDVIGGKEAVYIMPNAGCC